VYFLRTKIFSIAVAWIEIGSACRYDVSMIDTKLWSFCGDGDDR